MEYDQRELFWLQSYDIRRGRRSKTVRTEGRQVISRRRCVDAGPVGPGSLLRYKGMSCRFSRTTGPHWSIPRRSSEPDRSSRGGAGESSGTNPRRSQQVEGESGVRGAQPPAGARVRSSPSGLSVAVAFRLETVSTVSTRCSLQWCRPSGSGPPPQLLSSALPLPRRCRSGRPRSPHVPFQSVVRCKLERAEHGVTPWQIVGKLLLRPESR